MAGHRGPLVFKKVLIANRGEIALRIIRACKELGAKTVVVHSQADGDSLHVRFADEAVCVGPAGTEESYLNIPRLISAAEITNAEAIHPGYGFLAESPQFAEICESCGLKLIGPPAQLISGMGDKLYAKRAMREAGIPVIPGSIGPVEDLAQGQTVAEEIGFPLIIKAVAGGGGRGMRIVREDRDLENGFRTAQTEAKAAFGDSRLYMERYVERGRHIEFQILADNYGNIVHLGERECSVQRRYQKLIEESPSPALDSTLRKSLGELAVEGARSVGYQSAGTVEFLRDGNGEFYFMEMNTRIQVEHPVTEEVTGVDLIKEQIRLASGEKLEMAQDGVELRGHSLECRINAEDPRRNFAPCSGKVETFHTPGGPGVRVDTHVYPGYTVSPHYDSMIAKIICSGKDRQEAISRMSRALEEFVIEGTKTTLPLHREILKDEKFRRGELSTDFLEGFLERETGRTDS